MGIIKIAKALQNISTLTVFIIGDNNINEEAADDIGSVLSHNIQLEELYLHNNNFKTGGIIKIAKSLKNTVTLTVLSISDNDVGDEAADDIAAVCHIILNYKSYTFIIMTFKQEVPLRSQKH